MTELEQRLTNELGRLGAQYAQDQKRLAGQGDMSNPCSSK